MAGKGTAVAVILGGAVAGVGLATYLIKKSSTGCSSNLDCPNGQICQNGTCKPAVTNCTSNTQCPPGYVCQYALCVPQIQSCTGNIDCPPGQSCQNGICKTCSPQQCACDQVWDSVECQCSDLIPANLLAPLIANAAVNFDIHLTYDCTTGLASWSYGVSSTSTPCQLGLMGPYNDHPIVQPFVIQVVDSAGHPICNQQVNLSLTTPTGTTISFQTPNGQFSGIVTLSLTNGASQLTDSYGNIGVEITTQIIPDNQHIFDNAHCDTCCLGPFSFPCGVSQFAQTIPLTVQYNYAQNPNIRGITTTYLALNICGSYC